MIMDLLFPSYKEFIPEFDRFQERLRQPIPVHVRINRLKADPETVTGALARKGVDLQRSTPATDTLYRAEGAGSAGNLLEYFLGHIHPQALTSCLAAVALEPPEGAFVLDMCAAPGGKTSHMAQLMNNTGLIVANELYAGRHIPLGHTLERLGVLNAVITGYPAQEFPMRHLFDRIMADVPCSGEGRFRKLKRASRYVETGGREALPRLQKRIALRGFDLLRPGGEMLYATCTYNPEENESVVNSVLRRREARLLPIRVGIPHDPGIPGWKGEVYDPQIEKAARFYPHRVDSVGFFMARIGRRR